jgi:hypothetical protein
VVLAGGAFAETMQPAHVPLWLRPLRLRRTAEGEGIK